MPRKSKNPTFDELLSEVDNGAGTDEGDGAVAVLTGRTTKGGRKSKAKEEASARGYVIPRPLLKLMKVPIIGTTSLIVHSWSQKAIQMILDKQQKKPQKAKDAKNPDNDYNESRYISDDNWDGVPAAAFKAAIVGACRQVDGLSMTLAKRLAFIQPDGFSTKQNIELTRIQGKPRMRRDMVRVASGTADVRFRAEFQQWSAELLVEFNAQVIGPEQLLNLIAIAGYSEGIGEWRPSAPESATGTHGRWRVDFKKKISVEDLIPEDEK